MWRLAHEILCPHRCRNQKRGLNCVYLDMRHLPADELSHRFPNIDATKRLGIDMSQNPSQWFRLPTIFVVVSGPICMVFEFGGLYAIGDSSCTGLHGANRLASN